MEFWRRGVARRACEQNKGSFGAIVIEPELSGGDWLLAFGLKKCGIKLRAHSKEIHQYGFSIQADLTNCGRFSTDPDKFSFGLERGRLTKQRRNFKSEGQLNLLSNVKPAAFCLFESESGY